MTVRNGRQRSGQKEAGKIWIGQLLAESQGRKGRKERKWTKRHKGMIHEGVKRGCWNKIRHLGQGV